MHTLQICFRCLGLAGATWPQTEHTTAILNASLVISGGMIHVCLPASIPHAGPSAQVVTPVSRSAMSPAAALVASPQSPSLKRAQTNNLAQQPNCPGLAAKSLTSIPPGSLLKRFRSMLGLKTIQWCSGCRLEPSLHYRYVVKMCKVYKENKNQKTRNFTTKNTKNQDYR